MNVKEEWVKAYNENRDKFISNPKYNPFRTDGVRDEISFSNYATVSILERLEMRIAILEQEVLKAIVMT